MAASQVLHPTRAVIRTVFAAALSFAALFPTIVDVAHLPQWSGIAAAVAVAGAVTRVFALPQVEIFLQQYVPWLSAAPVAAETVVPDDSAVTPSGLSVPDTTAAADVAVADAASAPTNDSAAATS